MSASVTLLVSTVLELAVRGTRTAEIVRHCVDRGRTRATSVAKLTR